MEICIETKGPGGAMGILAYMLREEAARAEGLHGAACGVGPRDETFQGPVSHDSATCGENSSGVGNCRGPQGEFCGIRWAWAGFEVFLSVSVVHGAERGVLVDFKMEEIATVPLRDG